MLLWSGVWSTSHLHHTLITFRTKPSRMEFPGISRNNFHNNRIPDVYHTLYEIPMTTTTVITTTTLTLTHHYHHHNHTALSKPPPSPPSTTSTAITITITTRIAMCTIPSLHGTLRYLFDIFNFSFVGHLQGVFPSYPKSHKSLVLVNGLIF